MNTAWTPTKRSVIVAAALAATILAVVAPWPGAGWTAHHDNLDGAAPLRLEAARQWSMGRAPLWNPYKRAGMPLLADTTAGAIYPGNLPFLLAVRAQGEGDAAAFRALDRVAALHAVLAGLFLFAFLRTAGLAPAAAFLGGLVFGTCGTLGWLAAWYIQIQNSVAWLPLVLLALHRAAEGATAAPRWIALGGAAVALQFFAGFPETSVYSGLLAIGYAVSLSRRGRRARPLAAVAAVYAAGLLLAAVQILPAVELQLASRRPAALDLAAFQSLPAPLSMVWSWVVLSPISAFDFPPAAAMHFGAAAVLAAAVGLFTRSHLGAYFTAVLVVGFLLAVGPATPVSAWAWHLPGLSAFRHPFKHLFEVAFAMSGLAALGAERLLAFGSRPRWGAGVVVAAIVFTAVTARVNQASLVSIHPASVDTSGRSPAVVGRLEPGWRVMTTRDFFQKRDPAFLIGDYPTQFRVPAVHGAGPYLWAPLAAATGLIEEETTFRRGLFGAANRTLGLLSCRYVGQVRRGDRFVPAVDPSVYRVLDATPEERWMERDDALPRVRFVSSVRCAAPAEIARSLEHGDPDPGEVALIACAQGESPAPVGRTGAVAAIVQEEPGRLVIETSPAPGEDAFLVVSQADLPGWRAAADGVDVPLRRVHGLVQGLVVPGGTSQVVLSYAPRSVRAGAALSASTLALLALACLRAWRRGDG